MSALGYRCLSAYCETSSQKKLNIATRVTFLDVSQPYMYSENQLRQPQATVPGNFFYPLGFNTATSQFMLSSVLLKCFLIILAFLFSFND